ncbi:MAG: hypothetical protein P8X39_03025 [Desulfofustis sp.]|jgi:hypothetical protein
MFRSITSLLYSSFVIIGVSLLLVVVLGIRQYRINTQYSEISSLSERTLFGFSTIRDQITESMVSGNISQLTSVIPDIEQLNSQVTRLYDYQMIPAQYKLAMTDSVDLSGLVINLRKLESGGPKPEAGLDIQQEMRRIGENLLKVDRIITAHIRDSVINFQFTVIGTMGILISCASFVLIILYNRGVKPLLALSRQIEAEDKKRVERLSCPSEAGREIVRLVDSINEMLTDCRSMVSRAQPAESPDHELLSQTVNETTNGLNAVINYAELLLESDSAALSEEQRGMLGRIVESGNKVGARWQAISQEFTR